MPKIKVTSIRSDHQILATSGWHSKKRRKIDTNCEYSIREESLLPAKNQGNVEDSTLHTLLSPTDSTRRSNGSRENPIPTENLEDLSKVGQIDKREEHSPSLQRLHGTAVLAILPDKSVGGHLITSHGAFGLIGREVLSFRECTRDADWSVLRLTLIDFDNNGREVSFLAEKTGSDAMSLSSPVKWEGTEEENEKSLGSGCEAGMMLAFKCETIFSSEAADRILSLLMPKLSEQGLIVNQGHMSIDIPALKPMELKTAS